MCILNDKNALSMPLLPGQEPSIHFSIGHTHPDAHLPLQEAATVILEVSASLQASRTDSSTTVPQSASQAVLHCTHAALQPSVCGSDARAFTTGVWRDVLAILSVGREVVLVLLADVRALFARAGDDLVLAKERKKQLEGVDHEGADGWEERKCPGRKVGGGLVSAQGGIGDGQGRKRLVDQGQTGRRSAHMGRATGGKSRHAEGNEAKRYLRSVHAAGRKVWFLTVWANEQPQEAFGVIEAELAKGVADLQERVKRHHQHVHGSDARLSDQGTAMQVDKTIIQEL